MNKAVFLDRDGIINEMVYSEEHGHVDSPSRPQQFKLINGVTRAIRIAKKLGYKIIIISNQPGIAKGYYDKETFDMMSRKMHKVLKKSHTSIDDEFYCLHHPNAKISTYKRKCLCRKPGTGLIKKAIRIQNVDLKKSYFIGDGLVDMEAAKRANCRSIFVGNVNSTITELFKKKNIEPEYIAHNLLDAMYFIRDKEGT